MTTTPPPPAPDRDSAMRHYIIHQGQSIHKLDELLASNSVVRGFKAFLSVLLELALYLVLIGVIIMILLIPTEIVVTQEFSDGTEFFVGMTTREVIEMITGLKVVLLVLNLPVLIAALLLRRNRRKSFLLGDAAEIAAGMKAEYDRMFREMKM